jgi:hypothetical protein
MPTVWALALAEELDGVVSVPLGHVDLRGAMQRSRSAL